MLLLRTINSILFDKLKPRTFPDTMTEVQIQHATESHKIKTLITLMPKNHPINSEGNIMLGSKSLLQKYMIDFDASPELGKYLFNEVNPKIKEPRLEDAKNEFKQHNSIYNYFDEASKDRAEELYLSCYKLCAYQFKFIERERHPDSEVGKQAYKMIVLFGPDLKNTADQAADFAGNKNDDLNSTLLSIDKFFKANTSMDSTQIHTLFTSNLPVCDENDTSFNLNSWKKKLPVLGIDALKNFSDAPKISKRIVNNNLVDGTECNVPNDKQIYNNILMQIIYNNFETNPELAKLYKYYKVSEDAFNRTLVLMNNRTLAVDDDMKLLSPKEEDFIPNVSIKN
ncbi:MAG: hypothetical protein P8P83_06020 [Rickettsiaceae bacterium]|nr:hypothetical protein [Rickettsiaceae bacterium]